MDKLFVASLSNYFDNKNKKISKIRTIPALFQKPQSPLQTIFSSYQTEHGRKSTATKIFSELIICETVRAREREKVRTIHKRNITTTPENMYNKPASKLGLNNIR